MTFILGLLFLFPITGCTPHTTGSTEVGVRTNQIGLIFEKGVLENVYPPGSTSFFPPVVTDWALFDTAIQNLVMTREQNKGSRPTDDAIRFKTIDGNDISVNVTVAWRIDPNQAPYLLKFVGSGITEIEDLLIRPVSRSIIRDVLNELASEEYYNADIRFRKVEESQAILSQILSAEGIKVEQVLLGEHQFNQTYQQVIKDMKVAEQDASRLISETLAAGEEMKRELEKAKGGVQQTIEAAKGASKQRYLEADAIFYERQQQAEAILAEKTARAEGLTERARALSGSGGKNMVKLRVAESLKGKKIIFMPASSGMDVRTTDVNKLLQTYGVQKAVK
jgi:regulator of protease activity HflC (stomatin/prohibitin superfamily)